MAAWRLQIYLVSDRTSQELVAGLLAGIDTLVVEVANSDFDSFVIIESAGQDEADDVLRFVEAVDPGVKLIHTSTARSAEPRVL
jgi:hypothetical protein